MNFSEPLPKSVEVLVVGAGPGGGTVGRLLEAAGGDVLVLEEHKEIGRPVQCSGMVGIDFFEGRKFDLGRDFIINAIHGSRVEYGDCAFTLERKDVAWVLDRAALDRKICEGAPVVTSTKFLSYRTEGDDYVVETNQGEIRCKYLIGADGPHSKVRQAAGLKTRARISQAVQYRIETPKGDGHMVDVRFIRPFSHFSWMIPEGNGVARVGTVSDTPLQDLKKYLADRGIDGKIIQSIGGPIPVGFSQMVSGRIALVGDAACQVKPITSGGIFYAVRAGELLVECLQENRFDDYPARWEQTLGKEIRFCYHGREILERTSEDTLRDIFWFFGEKKNVIEQAGDFDLHSSIFWNLVKDPRAYRLAGSLIWDLITRTKSEAPELTDISRG